jgi:hypothetical protein
MGSSFVITAPALVNNRLPLTSEADNTSPPPRPPLLGFGHEIRRPPQQILGCEKCSVITHDKASPQLSIADLEVSTAMLNRGSMVWSGAQLVGL